MGGWLRAHPGPWVRREEEERQPFHVRFKEFGERYGETLREDLERYWDNLSVERFTETAKELVSSIADLLWLLRRRMLGRLHHPRSINR